QRSSDETPLEDPERDDLPRSHDVGRPALDARHFHGRHSKAFKGVRILKQADAAHHAGAHLDQQFYYRLVVSADHRWRRSGRHVYPLYQLTQGPSEVGSIQAEN